MLLFFIGFMGSPPLARGTEKLLLYNRLYSRITPACAGNSCRGAADADKIRDHPRLRGEQFVRHFYLLSIMGSPPLARGTVFFALSCCFSMRITPACAGNSKALALCARITGDHPRLRGEQAYHSQSSTHQKGSPPLARGTVLQKTNLT